MFIHLFYGFLLAFAAFITPAMLNMTTARTSIEQGKKAGILFGLGASIINAIHAIIAFSFLDYLDDSPEIIMWFKRIGVLILFSLAVYFYFKSKKTLVGISDNPKIPSFIEGLLTSFINMLGLPFYFTAGLALEANKKIVAIIPNIYYLSFGVFLGGFTIFSIYAIMAKQIAARSEFISKNLNLILVVIFIGLGVIVALNLLISNS